MNTSSHRDRFAVIVDEISKVVDDTGMARPDRVAKLEELAERLWELVMPELFTVRKRFTQTEADERWQPVRDYIQSLGSNKKEIGAVVDWFASGSPFEHYLK